MTTHKIARGKWMATRIRWTGIALCGGAVVLLAAQNKPAAAGKPPAPQAVAQLKLANPGFEEGEADVKDWQQGAALDGVEYLWVRDAGHDSKSSVAIRKTAQKYFPIAQWSQTVPRTGKTAKLRLSAFVKAAKMHRAILDVNFTTADGTSTHQWAAFIGAKKPSDSPASHGWKEYSGVVAIPQDTKELIIGLQVYGPGTVWFDDVKAEYVPDSTPVSLYDEQGNPKP